jgi:hypothetical protein
MAEFQFRVFGPTEIQSLPDEWSRCGDLNLGRRTWVDSGEHFVLNELTARLQPSALRYWRDKQGHEVDFIWLPRSGKPLAIECKWSARDCDPGPLLRGNMCLPRPCGGEITNGNILLCRSETILSKLPSYEHA